MSKQENSSEDSPETDSIEPKSGDEKNDIFDPAWVRRGPNTTRSTPNVRPTRKRKSATLVIIIVLCVITAIIVLAAIAISLT